MVVMVLWAAFFAINFNIAMMIPLLPFVQEAIGLSTTQAGAVLAVFPIVALVSNLALGPWIDRFGRKRFLVTGACGCTVLFLLTAMAGSAGALMLCRAAVGVFMPMIGATVFAAVADYVPEGDRARVSGYVTTAAPAAFLLAMSLGVLLAGYVTWQVPVLLIAGVTAGIAMGAARLPATPMAARSGEAVTLATYRRRVLAFSMGASTRRLLLGFGGWAMAMFVFLGMYPAWVIQHGLAGRGPGVISGMLFVGEVGGLVGALLAGRLARLHPRPLGSCALVGWATACVVVAVPLGGESVVFQAVAYAGYAFGRDVMLALILGGAMALVAPGERGSLNAMMNVVYQCGATAGAMGSAVLYAARPDFVANAVVSGAVFVVAAWSVWGIGRGDRSGG